MLRPLSTAAVLLALSCARAPPARAPEHDEATRQAMAADAAWSSTVRARDRDAFLGVVAGEAVFAGGRRLLRGREAIGAGWAVFFRPGGPRFAWQPDGGGAAPSGDLAWTTGSFRIEVQGDGAPQVTEGRYLSVWSREPGGRWRVELDCAYGPAAALEPLERTPVRTVTSSDRALEATLGTWKGQEAGARSGAWLRVRARSGEGWRVVLDSAVPLAEE